MIKIPENLQPYIDFCESGPVKKDLPEELEGEFRKFEKYYHFLQEQNRLAEY